MQNIYGILIRISGNIYMCKRVGMECVLFAITIYFNIFQNIRLQHAIYNNVRVRCTGDVKQMQTKQQKK